tara:strand:+ start:317 stop:508 length:192 start_codon:yes stop_codon:yes gene_type:complete
MSESDKRIVVTVHDGVIQSVFCPDETYVVDILDYDNWDKGVDESLDNYYRDVENLTDNLKDMY